MAGGSAGISITGGSQAALGANLRTDGGSVSLTGAVTLTTASATIDTDQNVGGSAGAITALTSIDGSVANANALIADARESGGGTGGQVTFSGAIGSSMRLGGLAVLGNAASFGSTANNVGNLAVALTGPNQDLSFTNTADLTIGAVAPASGITTNTGNVTVSVSSGTLTISGPINTIGGAAISGTHTGAIALNASGGATLNGPSGDVTTGSSFTVNADTDHNGGAYLQNAGADVSAAGVTIIASDVTLAGTIASAGNVTFLAANDASTIGIAANGGLSLSDAELDAVSAAGTLIVGSTSNTGGITIAGTSALTQDAKNLQFTTGGTIAIGNNNVTTTGSVGLAAASISTGSGAIVAPTITAQTASGMALRTNASALNLTNTGSGNIIVTNTGAVGVSGSNALGGLNVTTDSAVTAAGPLNAASVGLTGTSVALDNSVTAGTLSLTATAGSITQTAALSAGTLTGSATGAAMLANPANAIASIGPFAANGLTIVDGAGGLIVSGSVNAGPGAASITTSGNLAVNGTIDGNGVTLTANGGAIQLGAAVDAHAGTAALQGPVSVTAAATVSGANVNFAGVVNGNAALTVSTAGTATFGGAVGGTTPLASLLANAATTAVNGGLVETSGTQTYNGAVTLGANTTFSGTGATFAAGITANGFDLALDFSGTTALNGSSFTGVHNLSTGNGGATTLSGTIATSGTQAFGDAVTLSGNAIATSSGAGATGNVTFGTVDATFPGAQSLTVNTAGTTTFGAAVGGAVALASLTTNAAGTTAITGGSITTTGAQTYHDAVTLGATTTLTSTALGGVTFDAGLNGANALTIDTSGTTTFSGMVGDQVALTSLTTNAGGTTAINGGFVNTGGAQTYNDAVTLGGATTLTSQNGGAITFGNTVHTDTALTISTAGSATFTRVISGAGGLVQNGSGTMTLSALNTYTGATTVNAGTLLVDGSIASSSLVTVNGGATLGGSGTTGAVTVASGGILAAGASPGILHTGALELQAGAVLKIEIAGGSAGTGFDQIDVTGAVTLTGATLSLSLVAPYLPTAGDSYIIIINDGTDDVTGTFSGLAEGTFFQVGGSSYRITYQGGSGNDVVLTAFNDAPVLTSASPVFPAITEDDVTNAGQLVSDFRGAVTDADATTTFGIAITSASTGGGHWQYQLSGSSTWIDVSTPDAAHALLLRDEDRIRFLPDAANGTSASFTYRAWDQSSGAAGLTADTSTNGGVTAFSTTENTASLTVSSINDAPAQAANTGLTVGEGGTAPITATQLSFTDVDAGAPSPTYTLTTAPQHGTLLRNGVSLPAGGTFTQADVAAGLITYTHDGGETTADSFGFSVSDGTATVTGQTFAFAVTPVNDPPVAQAGSASGDEDTVITGTLQVNDSDNSAFSYALVQDAAHGTVTIHADGTFSYTPDGDYFGPDSFTYKANDGSTDSNVATVTLTVSAVNDAPTVGTPVQLTPIGVNSGAHTITRNDLLANVHDVDSAMLQVANLRIDAGNGTLVDNHDDTWTYTPKNNDDTFVKFAYEVTDGAATVADSATLDIEAAQQAPALGTPGNDSYTAPTGNSQFDAHGGLDTITFGFKLTDATFTWSGNEVIVDTATSHTVLSGFEVFEFTDGTVNTADGDRLVDDLYYYTQNHDVWNAHVSADTHYHAIGWKEGRDPSAFFSLSTYLSLNPDVKAAGIDPLLQFDQGGWKTARPVDRIRQRRLSGGQSGREGRGHRSAVSLPGGRLRRKAASRSRRPRCLRRMASTMSITCSTIRTSRRRTSIRSCTSRPSAGRKGAIRTPISTRPAISRTIPTSLPRASTRSITMISPAGRKDAIRRPTSTRSTISATTPTSRRRTSIR